MTTTSTTQGEHAQTEALDAAQTLEYWAKDLKGLLGSELLFAATKLRSLHAQVAALTAAPSVSDGLRTLHDAILNRLSHAELLEKAHYLMELNSNQARTIGELQDLVEAAPAQPAAPQGVAYAELPDEHAAFETWARLRSDWRPNLERKGDGYVGAFADEAWRGWSARASNGQAPAGAADDDEVDLPDAEDMAHSALQEALSFGLSHDVIYRWMRAIQDQTVKAMRTPTAQAAPAAGAVAVPRETLVAWRQWCAQSMSHAIEHEISDWLAAAPTPAAQADSQPSSFGSPELQAMILARCVEKDKADSVLEDAAREAIEKVLALFPFNVPIQKFTINNGPCLTADNDDEFYSVKRVLAFLTEIKTTLAAARKQGGA